MRFRDKVKTESLHASGREGRPRWGEGVGRVEGDVPEGTALEFDGEFVTQQQTRVDGEVVCRLSVRADGGDCYDVVLPPAEGDRWLDLLTGARYTVTGLLAHAPRTLEERDEACPNCGGGLRAAGVVDQYDHLASTVETLGVADRFVVCEDVQPVASDDGPVDDWVPRRERTRTSSPSGYVCVDCGRGFESYEVGGSDPDGGATDERFMNKTLESAAPAADQSMGLAVGGSRDVQNFRENVHEGYVPQVDALGYEGLFYDYQFPTADPDDETEDPDDEALFTPTYSRAVAENPVTGEEEQYLSVGLDSSLTVGEFERPVLDLVAVLDVSGSMSSPFNDYYYYDATGAKRSVDEDGGLGRTKMEAAAESLCALTEQLESDDRLGIVLFNSSAHVAKPLRDVGETDMSAIRRHIREVRAGGGTNMEAGFETARGLLEDADSDDEREHRVVFMTDAMPNTGETRGSSLAALVDSAAEDGVYTTFVGMGLDENERLMQELSAVRGANHYFVHSAAEFERRLGEEFNYMVSPLVFDLSLSVDADGYEIDGVYGVPDADEADGEVLHVTTLFPSPTSDGESRGGVILVRLRRTGDGDGSVDLDVSWDEGDGRSRSTHVDVSLPNATHYDGVGVRKAVALARYGRVLREWAAWARGEPVGSDEQDRVDDWVSPMGRRRTEHERGSAPIRVSERHVEQFRTLRAYLADELDAVDDESLGREIEVLDALLPHAESKVENR